ncbi:MAG: T9SS type A sorting domain-containing protein, partial [Bacteroidia bacterium]
VDQVGQTNNFDNMDMGIYCLLSGLRVYNTNFKNITGTSGNAGRCIASYSNSSVERALIVGGSANAYQKNSFINSSTGVYASANMEVTINSNIMNNLTTGVSINNCGYIGNVINISGNTIDDCSTGIYTIDCKNSTNLFVVGNNINLAVPTINSKPNSKAISIVNTSINTSSSLVPLIGFNNIKRVSTGIEVTNYVAPSIQNNNITALSDLGAAISSHGILVTNCPALNLRTNVVKGIGASSWWMNGIRVESGCVASVVLYNSVEDIGRGLFFGGWNIATETAKNNMKNNWDGFLLNWGVIGYQNGSSASCKATENKWEGTFLNSHIYSYYSDGTQSTFNLYGSPCNTSSGPCMNPNNITSLVTPTSSSGYTAVPTPVCPSLSGRSMDSNKLNQFVKIAKDEYSFQGFNNNNESVQWWAKYSLFNLMQFDTTLKEDAELKSFWDNNLDNNIGKLYHLNELLNSGNVNTINASINSLNAENNIEQNLKDVYSITISNRINNSLNNNEINKLRSIAKLCPYESGPAVYNARVLLATVDSTTYKNVCEIVPYGKHKNMLEVAQGIDVNNIVVFPNPTNDKLNISVQLEEEQLATIKIYDLAGNLMLIDTFNRNNNSAEVSVAILNEGMYIYKLNINDENVKIGKLIITR